MPQIKNKHIDKQSGPLETGDKVKSQSIDIQFNPDMIHNLLNELQSEVNAKCLQLQKDSDSMTTSIQQAFHLELIKLPSHVKSMSLRRFRDEFGDSLEAVTRSAIKGRFNNSSKSNLMLLAGSTSSPVSTSISTSNCETLQHQHCTASQLNITRNVLGNATRIIPNIIKNPRENDKMVLVNRAPTGDFKTIIDKKPQKKLPKNHCNKNPKNENSKINANLRANNEKMMQPTPGLLIPLESGDIIDMETLDLKSLSEQHREDAMMTMQIMMNNIQSAMSKIEKK